MKTETIIFLTNYGLPLSILITMLWLIIGAIVLTTKSIKKKNKGSCLWTDDCIDMMTYGLIGGSSIPLATSIYLLYVEHVSLFEVSKLLVPTFVIGLLILALKILGYRLHNKRLV